MKKIIPFLLFILSSNLVFAQDEIHICQGGAIYENGNLAKGSDKSYGDASFRIYYDDEKIEFSTEGQDIILFFTSKPELDLRCSIFELEKVQENSSRPKYRLEICENEISLYFQKGFENNKTFFKNVAHWKCNN